MLGAELNAMSSDASSMRVIACCVYAFAATNASATETNAAQVRRALAEATEVVARIADDGAEKPSSLNLLVSDGRVLVACRRGRTLHLAADAGPRHAFVVASEPVGRGARWEEVPEGGFVSTEDGRAVERGVLLVA